MRKAPLPAQITIVLLTVLAIVYGAGVIHLTEDSGGHRRAVPGQLVVVRMHSTWMSLESLTRHLYRGGGVSRGLAGLAAEDLLQLLFVHARPTLDAALLGLVAQLVVGPAARTAVGPKPAPATRREVVDRGRARLFGLAVPGALLVHRPGGDLFRLVLVRAALEQPFFDVFVLA